MKKLDEKKKEGLRKIYDMLPVDGTAPIRKEDLPEFVGQMIDIFEDFLEEKGVDIPNPEKEDAEALGEDPDGMCRIYGTDYGTLQTQIESMLEAWRLTSR